MANDPMTPSFHRFKLVALLEGWSFILLLCVAMPLKYVWEMPLAVKWVGMAHGVLFIIYNIYVLAYRSDWKWDLKKTLWAMFLSVVPLGSFYLVRTMR